jgi:hypothetical protein
MDSTTNRLSGPEIAQLISDGVLCPYPKPRELPRHRDDNAELINKLSAMSHEEQDAWLAERRKQRAAILAASAQQ